MDARTMEQYRRRLIRNQRDLVASVIGLEDQLDETVASDDVEHMDRVQADVLADSLELLDDLEREQMEAVEAALERIENGTYGKCIDCGKEIPRERLEAVPWAERCAEDQERFECERQKHLERTGGKPRG
jgi:DnaK suppressor protein